MENNDIQEIAKKKRYLKRYRKNKACVNRLEEKLYLLEERITTVRTSSLSGMPRGGVVVTIDDLISDKEDLEDRIKRLKRKGKAIRSEILEEIDSLDDPRYCEILEAYFIDGLSMERIADNIAYTPRHVYRLYEKAVSMLTIKRQ